MLPIEVEEKIVHLQRWLLGLFGEAEVFLETIGGQLLWMRKP